MYAFFPTVTKFITQQLIVIGLLCPFLTIAADTGYSSLKLEASVPTSLKQNITDLRFREFFNMPIGSRGLQPTEKLLQLNGKRVRILGYMVKQEQSLTSSLLLTPLPVTMGDEDESLADDLPPTTVFVHLEKGGQPIPYVSGLIKLTGVLSVGGQEEGDGRVSTVRLMLDAATSEEFLNSLQQRHTSK